MYIDDQVKNRRAIEALRNGVPNRDAVAVLGCTQPEIEAKFRLRLQDTKSVFTSGGKNEGIILAGGFGTGKSHLLEYLMHQALEQNFVCSKIVISKETPLFDSAKLYRAATESAVLPGKRGNAMTEIATALNFNNQNYVDFYKWTNTEANINSRFAATLFLFERMSNDPALSNRIIRFWSGDKMDVGEIKRYLKEHRESVTYKMDKIAAKEFSLQRFKFATRLMIAAGYSGWVLLIDEVEMISQYSILQRAKSYVELARWMGKLDQTNIAGLTSVLAITDDFQEAILVGRDDLQNVPNRLRAKNTDGDLLLASQAERGMRVIQNELTNIKAPDKNVLSETYEKVKSIHAKAYDWNPPPVRTIEHMASNRMRQYIKGWITEWDLKRLDPGYNPEIEVEELKQDYTEDTDLEIETEVNLESFSPTQD